jgi:Na+/proline symporter
LIQRYYCVADEREAVKVGWMVTVLNAVGPPLMLLPAIAGRHFLGDVPDAEVYPRLCIELLPAGILGLVIAAMFAATMSMLSSDYNACAGVLTNDVYRRLFRRGASQKELVLVGRLMTVLVGGFALGAAFLMAGGSGQDLFENMVTLFGIVTAPIGVPMILGLVSRRVSNVGALVGCGSGVVVGLLLLWRCPDKLVLTIGGPDDAIFFCEAFGKEIVIFVGTLVVTSLFTLWFSVMPPMRNDECDRVDAFHRRLATPIGQMEEDRTTGSAGFSPFRVVGISIICIAVMLLAILPSVGKGLALGLTIGFGVVLLVIGGLMTLMSGRSGGQEG